MCAFFYVTSKFIVYFALGRPNRHNKNDSYLFLCVLSYDMIVPAGRCCLKVDVPPAMREVLTGNVGEVYVYLK